MANNICLSKANLELNIAYVYHLEHVLRQLFRLRFDLIRLSKTGSETTGGDSGIPRQIVLRSCS